MLLSTPPRPPSRDSLPAPAPDNNSSDSLAPPLSTPVFRARAASTGVRPPLSLTSLSRVCPSTPDYHLFPDLSLVTTDDQSRPSSSSHQQSQSQPGRPASFATMVPVLISRTYDLFRAIMPGSAKHRDALFESPLSSPRSSIDSEYVLPLSSSRKSSFDSVDCAPPQIPSIHAPLLLVIILFPISTALALFSLSTLPISASWPRTLADLAQIGSSLNAYAQSGPLQTLHVLAVLSVSAVWKHAWSIPGSVLWNVLAGALFHPLLATLFMTVLTTIGSIFASLLSMPLGPFLTRFFPKSIELTRAALEGNSSDPEVAKPFIHSTDEKSDAAVAMAPSGSSPAWVRLSVLRLVGVVPWSALNVACGVTGVSLRDCVLGAFIGTLPWTAVTCQIGDILHTVGVVSTANTTAMDGSVVSGSATLSSVLASPQIIMELVFLSVLSLAPILGRNWLRRFISSSEKTPVTIELETEPFLSEKDSLAGCYEHNDGSEVDLKTMSDEELDGGEYDKLYGRGRRQRRQRWRWNRISLSVSRWSMLHSPSTSSFPDDRRQQEL